MPCLLISRFNDPEDSTHLASQERPLHNAATIAKTIFEIDCAWYSSFKFILGVSQVVAYIVFREF